MKCPVCGIEIKEENLKGHLEADYMEAEIGMAECKISMALVLFTAKERDIKLDIWGNDDESQ